MADDPYEEFRGYAREYQTLGEGTPTAEDRAKKEQESVAAGEAYGRFQRQSPVRQFMSGARHTVGSMPLISRIPPVRRFANPEAGTEAASDLQDFRTGLPGTSRAFGAAGSVVPYAGAGAVLPGLFSRLPGAMAGNAAIGGTDAYLGGENPMAAGLRDAVATIPGSVAGRIVTPRGQAATDDFWKQFQGRQSAVIDRGIDEAIDALNRIQAGHLATHPRATMRPRTETGGFSPRASSTEAAEEFQRLAAQMEALQAELARVSRPTMQVPSVGPQATDRIERGIRDATNSAMMGMLSAGAGSHFGLNPLLTGAAGMAAPRIAQWGTDRVNRAIEGLNRRVLSDDAPGLPRTILAKVLNNQILSDRERAILNGLSAPATVQGGEVAMQAVAPSIIDLIGGALGGRQAPTLGGN